jgi:hypothetical protein
MSGRHTVHVTVCVKTGQHITTIQNFIHTIANVRTACWLCIKLGIAVARFSLASVTIAQATYSTLDM